MPDDPPMTELRRAQHRWASTPLRQRLKIVRAFRHGLAEKATWLAEAMTASSPLRCDPAETLTAEVLPLCDAAKYLEKEAAYWLRPQRVGGILGTRRRPLWLAGASSAIHREPFGVVLVIAAGNYPLLLPGVQAMQALCAGNAVVLKPGRGGGEAAGWLHDLWREAGLPEALLHVADESVEAAAAALDAGVDKVFLTGSVPSGRAVLERCAQTVTPACVELSGSDAVFVLTGADLGMVVKAVAFGLRLNGSQTCIAPRRVLVEGQAQADALRGPLVEAIQRLGSVPVDPVVIDKVRSWIDAAQSDGAELLHGNAHPSGTTAEPFVLWDASPESQLVQGDVFAPVVSVLIAADQDDLLAVDDHCPYALGASVFGEAGAARRFAQRVNAGSVTVNDLIVPTADPRLPFGGRGQSGFGVTRGAEGLLEMTRVKVVTTRRGSFRPHYDEPGEHDADTFAAYLRAAHGRGIVERLGALPALFRGLKQMQRKPSAEAPAHESSQGTDP